ncbi:MAG: hypothetical protein WCF90_01330, partial [Methanomicrobiales archaeon]
MSAPLSFAVTNVNTGHITVEVANNSETLLTKTFAIMAPQSPIYPESEGYGGSGGSALEGRGAPQSDPAELVAPPCVTGASATILSDEEGQVLAQYA